MIEAYHLFIMPDLHIDRLQCIGWVYGARNVTALRAFESKRGI